MDIFQRVSVWLLNFACTQLFVTAFSMPILAYWGLPISALSPIGNLVSAPIMAVFIFLSCLIFFSELLLIPNGVLLKLLQLCSKLILKLVSLGSNFWLCGLKEGPMLFVVPFLALWVVFNFKGATRFWMLFMVVCFIFPINRLFPTENFIQNFKLNNSKVILEYNGHEVQLSCKAKIGTFHNLSDFLEYRISTFLYRKTGKNCLNKVKLDQAPSQKLKSEFEKYFEVGSFELQA